MNLETFIHETIHYICHHWGEYTYKLGDEADENSEVNRMAKRIARLLVKKNYRHFFK